MLQVPVHVPLWDRQVSWKFLRVAKRHIHFTPEDAAKSGVKDKDIVWVRVETDGRKAILGDVVCRVSPNYATAMHIDTDESNAIGAGRNQMGEIVTVD